MHVAVIFCADPDQERRQNENRHSFFGRSEEEFLPEAIEFKTPACFQLAKVFKVNSQIDSCAAAEPERSGNAV